MAVYNIRKSFRRDIGRYKICNNLSLNNADFSIMSQESCELTSNHIESCRKILSRFLKRQKGHPTYKILVKCHVPVTSKSKNSRMGKGKGAIDRFIYPLKPFGTIFIVRGISFIGINVVTCKIRYKLPIPLCIGVIKKQTKFDE